MLLSKKIKYLNNSLNMLVLQCESRMLFKNERLFITSPQYSYVALSFVWHTAHVYSFCGIYFIRFLVSSLVGKIDQFEVYKTQTLSKEKCHQFMLLLNLQNWK